MYSLIQTQVNPARYIIISSENVLSSDKVIFTGAHEECIKVKDEMKDSPLPAFWVINP